MIERLLTSLFGRITLILATASVWGALFPLVFMVNGTVPVEVLAWVLILSTGVVAGFAARLILRGKTKLLQTLVAAISVLVGLIISGALSQGVIGFICDDAWFQEPRWRELAEWLTGIVGAFVTIFAWSKPKIKPVVQPVRRPGERQASGSQKKGRRTPRKTPRRSQKTPRGVWRSGKLLKIVNQWQKSVSRHSRSVRKSMMNKLSTVGSSAGHFLRRFRGSQLGLPQNRNKTEVLKLKKPLPNKSSRVHLSSEVEYRCPYCLEEIKPNDSRGVKICPICHTRHHLDCWSVTGTCQVPHHYE